MLLIFWLSVSTDYAYRAAFTNLCFRYWLYAAIKFKCLLVTNDEMRDHLFQLLGNDFFPKWKERHQVLFGKKSFLLDLCFCCHT